MAPGVNSLNATYFANGTGRDTYISRDPVVHVGISERTPRPEIRNKPGITPRPPSSLDRGSKPMGYTGFLPGRPKGVGKSYSTLSEQQDTKNLIPPLVLKHRFVQPPGGQFSCVTSREYGSHFKNKDKKPEVANGAQTERKAKEIWQPGRWSETAKSRSSKSSRRVLDCRPYTGYNDPAETQSAYWQQHKVGGPASPRAHQRSTTQDADVQYSQANAETEHSESRQILGLTNIPQGYSGYKPRFRYCHVNDDANRHLAR